MGRGLLRRPHEIPGTITQMKITIKPRWLTYLVGIIGTGAAVLLGIADIIQDRLIPLIAALLWLPFFIWLTITRTQK
jgi:hypothetical protein